MTDICRPELHDLPRSCGIANAVRPDEESTVEPRSHRAELVRRRPFRLRGWAEVQPAGAYTVDMEEELIEGLSLPAWQHPLGGASP